MRLAQFASRDGRDGASPGEAPSVYGQSSKLKMQKCEALKDWKTVFGPKQQEGQALTALLGGPAQRQQGLVRLGELG